MTVYLWAEGGEIHSDGTDESELLIIPERVLEAWLPLVDVLACGTWGEVKALGPAVYQEVLGIAGYGEFADFIANFAVTGQTPGLAPGPDAIADWMSKQEAEVPSDEQGFDAYNDIPMVADGDWPPHIRLLMADNLPAEVLGEFAQWTYTSFNGDFARIPLDHKEEVFAKLKQSGHAYREDPRVLRLIVDL